MPAKVYDRPERPGFLPALLVAGLLLLLLLGYGLYRWMSHPTAAQLHSEDTTVRLHTAFWYGRPTSTLSFEQSRRPGLQSVARGADSSKGPAD